MPTSNPAKPGKRSSLKLGESVSFRAGNRAPDRTVGHVTAFEDGYAVTVDGAGKVRRMRAGSLTGVSGS